MPIASIKFRPGIDRQRTPVLNEGGWSYSQLIRWKDGLPQAIGGWETWLASPVSSPPRIFLSWIDLNGKIWTAIGTDTPLYVVNDGVKTDITPAAVTTNPVPNFSTTAGSNSVTIIDSTGFAVVGGSVNIVAQISVGGLILQGPYAYDTITNTGHYTILASTNASSTVTGGGAVPSFTTTASSTTVTVTFANHGQVVGSSFAVPIATTVGGITLSGTYIVQTVTNANTFTITAASAATSGATASMNGGNAQFVYSLQSNPPVYANYSYGVGGYGVGAYGYGSIFTPTTTTPTVWTMANWGETLIACQQNGPIYYWTPNNGQATATIVPNAPTVNGGIFVAMPQQILVAWSSSVGGAQQPLLLQWSNVLDYTDWTPTVTNQAGSLTLPSGSKIVAGAQGPQQALIWTDVDLWSLNYLGGYGEAQLVFGLNKLANNCGLIAPRAYAILDDVVYWLSPGKFMLFSGAEPMPLHCTVWDEIFQDLDLTNAHKIVMGSNSLFHEVWCFYPSISGGTGENDKYVKFNVVEKAWDYGSLSRTAWLDYSPAGNPLGGDATGAVYQHETGTTANGSPLNWSLTSGAVMIAEGNQMSFVDWLLPDFWYGLANQSSTDAAVTVTVSAYDFAGSTPVTYPTLTFTSSNDNFAPMRLRGRHLTFNFSGVAFARLGNVRYRVAQDGRY